MAPPLPPNLTSALPFDRDSSLPAQPVWPPSAAAPPSVASGPAHHHHRGPSPSYYHHSPHAHPLHYLAATAPSAGGAGLLPSSSSPTSSPRGSYPSLQQQQHHQQQHQHQHQQQHQSPLHHGSAEIPYTSLPPLLAPPLHASFATGTHLYRSSGLSSDADERREQTAQQREDSKYSPPALRHAPS
jgi:hypothetical protein